MKAYFYNRIRSEDVNGHGWLLLEDLVYYSVILGRCIVIKKNFTCDSYSAPRLLAFMVYNLDRRPAFLHDWLCAGNEKGIDRKMADRIIVEAMKSVGIGWLTRRLIYRGVRVGDYLGIGGDGYEAELQTMEAINAYNTAGKPDADRLRDVRDESDDPRTDYGGG